MKIFLKVFLILMGALMIAGCAGVISKETLKKVTPISFTAVFENPDAYKDQLVLWGGVVISTRNLKEGTLIEVLQKRLGQWKRPEEGDDSQGRFLALHEGYLDPAIYAKNREVTIAGTVKGRRVKPLGEIEYTYPLIAVKEIYLWKETIDEPAPHPYPYLYRYRPWWHYPYW